MTEQEFLDRFDNKKVFIGPELEDIMWNVSDEFNIVDTIYGENDRWSRPVTTIIKIEADSIIRYFAIYWDEGLTEMQPNSFEYQPEEVYPSKNLELKTDWLTKEETETTKLSQFSIGTKSWWDEINQMSNEYKIYKYENSIVYDETLMDYVKYLERYGKILENRCQELVTELDSQTKVLDSFKDLLIGEC